MFLSCTGIYLPQSVYETEVCTALLYPFSR